MSPWIRDDEQAEADTEVSRGLPLYSENNLPEGDWGEFRKIATTRMIRIDGPFRVATSESENEPFLCEDGWLAIDARGYPYALAASEQAQIYRPVVDMSGNPLEGRI